MKLRTVHEQSRRLIIPALSGVLMFCLTSSPLNADMMLTTAGVDQNLTLSTFATGFPSSSSVGPLGIAFLPSGGLLVSDYPGNVRLFATDADGQNASSAPVAQNYGGANAVGLAQTGGQIYMTRQATGDLVQINPNGTFNQVIVTGMPDATGIVADQLTGHLFVSLPNSGVIYDVDPVAKTKIVFATVADPDGLTMSADGSTLYAEANGHIIGWNTTSKAQVFDSGAIPGGPDGTAIGAGFFAGELFVNTNSGQLIEINQSTHAQTLLATGGSRGDFVTVDPNNDTLLLTQTDRVLRVTGITFTTTPEPTSLGLVGVGFGLAVLVFRRRLSSQNST